MSNPIILIQAASRAWSGAPDWCMNEIEDRPVVALTIDSALAKFPDADIRIIAPEFDKGGRLNDIPDMFQDKKISVFYGKDDSPLDRMIEALEGLDDDTLAVRVDGLHFAWLPEHAQHMLETAEQEGLDCMKLPDDFPVQLSSDIYRLGALKKAASMLSEKSDAGEFKIHPKFYMFQNNKNFKCKRYENHPPVSKEWLSQCRKTAKGVYTEDRMQADKQRAIKSGDQLTFHYELALDYISSQSTVLDCACGPGYGARILAPKAAKIVAADLDLKTVRNAAAGKYFDNITFQTADVTALEFADNSFDAVTSFETVEHVDPGLYFKEMLRVIKPGGLLILSTPQNSMGQVPVNSQHLREFSLEEITTLCADKFEIVKTIGIKQGRVVFENDPKGQNTFIVCRKPE